MSSPESSCSNDYLTVDFTGADQERVCQVCGATPAGNHFDVVSCRPCSAFFRRTVVLNRNFICKLKGNCPINKNIRSICSHCRFKKCVSLGMNANNINLNYDKACIRKVSNQLPNIIQTSKTPLIDKMLEGYRKFCDETNKLFYVCNPEELFSGDKLFKPGTVFEDILFNRSQTVYILDMLMNSYPPFDNMNETDRKAFFRGFCMQFTRLRMFHLNTLYLVDDDDKLVMQYGRYMDRNNQEYFYKTETNPKQSAKLLQKIQIRMFQLAAKFRRIKVDEMEVVALSGLILWKEANVFFGDLRYGSTIDQILIELAWYEQNKNGGDDYKVRVGLISCIQRDLEELILTMEEAKFMAAFMNKHVGPPKFADLEKVKRQIEEEE